MINLFIGDCGYHIAVSAKKYDAGAFLVDFSNYKKILEDNHQDITIYTSLGDLPKIDKYGSVLWKLILKSDKIFYCPPVHWSDHNDGFSWVSQQVLTEYYVYSAKLQGKITNYIDLTKYKESKYLELAEYRTSDQPCLWISGCSISHGVGVDPDQRYGYIVGSSTDRPTYHLTRPGSSLEWQADQILRSDIQKLDIVIWGLTEESRAPCARNGKIIAWPDHTIEDINYRSDETRYYKAITSTFQVINFCNKVGCRLILLPLLCKEKLQMDLINQLSYYQLPYQENFLDIGTDGIHPGPRQHQAWADFCIDILRNKL